jgi:hypothetical protein
MDNTFILIVITKILVKFMCTKEKNKKIIQNGGVLNSTSNSTLYRVSNAEDWKIDSNIYATKDSLLICTQKC